MSTNADFQECRCCGCPATGIVFDLSCAWQTDPLVRILSAYIFICCEPDIRGAVVSMDVSGAELYHYDPTLPTNCGNAGGFWAVVATAASPYTITVTITFANNTQVSVSKTVSAPP